MLRKIIESPYLNLLCGSILLISAGNEIWHNFGAEGLRAHHGVAFFGLIQILKSIPDILEGFNHVNDARNNLAAKIGDV